MLSRISKTIVLVCLLLLTLTSANLFAAAIDGENEHKVVVMHPKQDDERVIITTTTEIVENEYCGCVIKDEFPWLDPPLVKLMRTLYKPFKFAGKLFKSKN